MLVVVSLGGGSSRSRPAKVCCLQQPTIVYRNNKVILGHRLRRACKMCPGGKVVIKIHETLHHAVIAHCVVVVVVVVVFALVASNVVANVAKANNVFVVFS